MATIEEQEYGAPTFSCETCSSHSASPSAERSIARIARALAVTPIENGFSHEAEILIAAHVAAFGDAHLFEATTSAPSPSWSADWLLLLGRSEDLTHELRRKLLAWGLANPGVAVRDSAIQAADLWSDPGLASLLAQHDEPEEWLQSYAAAVVRDLSDCSQGTCDQGTKS